jgi:CRP-like cAMP-binding protein
LQDSLVAALPWQVLEQLLALGETLGRREGKWIVLKPRLTHQMLADMLGIRRETVTVHLRQLTKPGAVQAKGGRIALDSIALRKLIRGAHDTSTRVP